MKTSRFIILFLLILFSANNIFAGRYYDSRTGRWLSVDPKAGKYPGLSPYNYCANNPLKFVDPDGKKIEFAQGSSNAFRDNFNKTVAYLKEHNALGPLADVINNKNYTVTLTEGKTSFSKYDPNTNTLTWNTHMGVFTTKGVIIYPATGLVHESDHAKQENTNHKQFVSDVKPYGSSYDNPEEKRVITGSEQETAKNLGEIKEGEVTREDHGGTPYYTKDPTSTKAPYEIDVKGN